MKRALAWIVLAAWLWAAPACEYRPQAPAPPGPSTRPALLSPWNLPGVPPHLVAHYMPWFSDGRAADPAERWKHWRWSGPGTPHDPDTMDAAGRRDIASVDYPLIGPYDSSDRRAIRYHLRTAQAAGIQAFTVIWYGPGSDTDRRLPALLDEAQKLGLCIAVCYEEKINFPPYRQVDSRAQLVERVVADLSYIVLRYGRHPAYLRREGRPFIFQFNAWGMRRLGPGYLVPSEWKQVFARLPEPIVYARQNLDQAYHPPIAGAYLWWTPDSSAIGDFHRRAGQMIGDGRLQFFMAMISPGLDDSGVSGWGAGSRLTPGRGVDVLRMTGDQALNAAPELVQIVTWNDFNEGTAVEPTADGGFTLLDAIETWWGGRTGKAIDLTDNAAGLAEYRSVGPPEPAGNPGDSRP